MKANLAFRTLAKLTAAGLLLAGVAAAQDAPEKPTPEPKPAQEIKPQRKAKPAATLKAGDKAPALNIEKWVKGSEVKSFEPGKTYVVEFWATWCGPCIKSMPHLTALQAKNKNITFIGVTSKDPNNSLEAVETMVKEKGDGMGYTVAWDNERKTNEAFMEAAGQGGIPCLFLIDGTGTIAWIGHPMFLDIPLDLMASGKWDAKTGPDAIAKAEKAMGTVYEKMQDSPKDAFAAFEKLEKEYPALAEQMGELPFEIALRSRDYAKAYSIAGKLVDNAVAHKDAMALNGIAWTIVDPEEDHEKRDLDIAMRAAVKADEFSGGKDAAIIDTLARVHFLKGDVKKAIELQTKAIGFAKGPMAEQLKKSLEEYKAKAEKKEVVP